MTHNVEAATSDDTHNMETAVSKDTHKTEDCGSDAAHQGMCGRPRTQTTLNHVGGHGHRCHY